MKVQSSKQWLHTILPPGLSQIVLGTHLHESGLYSGGLLLVLPAVWALCVLLLCYLVPKDSWGSSVEVVADSLWSALFPTCWASWNPRNLCILFLQVSIILSLKRSSRCQQRNTNPYPRGNGGCEDRAIESEHHGKHNSVSEMFPLAGGEFVRKEGIFCWGLYRVPGAAVTKYYSLGGLEQQKFILSQAWRPEFQDQGVGRAHALWEL